MIRWTELERCWSADTSADPDGWSPENPAWGQCAVTALVVQDRFGGIEIDLTRQQFATWVPDEEGERERSYVLSFPDTRARYDRLVCALEEPY